MKKVKNVLVILMQLLYYASFKKEILLKTIKT